MEETCCETYQYPLEVDIPYSGEEGTHRRTLGARFSGRLLNLGRSIGIP